MGYKTITALRGGQQVLSLREIAFSFILCSLLNRYKCRKNTRRSKCLGYFDNTAQQQLKLGGVN